MGFEVEGWDCQESFVNFANELLVEEGYRPTVEVAARNQLGNGRDVYDGFIVGWGAYTLVHGRARRIALLRRIRARVAKGSPLLLSFHVRGGGNRRFIRIARVANIVRSLTFRPAIETGDSLDPNLVHLFTAEELRSELADGGFVLESYAPFPFGNAVGIAAATPEDHVTVPGRPGERA
jgi:hypothetical protein